MKHGSSRQDHAQRPRNAIVYNSGLFNSSTPPMLSLLRLLKQRYESVLANPGVAEGSRGPTLRRNLQSLLLAEAVLEKGELNRAHPDHPTQIAVFGPTQAGKSSVVNWLLA